MAAQRVPWAEWSPFPGKAGGTTTGGARKITLHTTEGGGWPSYSGGGTAPHLTVNPATGQARQHIDLDKSAYALASPGAPNSPNMNAGLVHIQIEIIGYAAQTPGYNDDWYRALAGWVGWLCDELAVPRAAPWPFMASSTAVRQTWGPYAAASGIIGHQHAPYNDHWDPGALDIARLLALMDPQQPDDEQQEDEDMRPWIAQDTKRIALVWIDPHRGEIVWENVGIGDSVSGWAAAGVPGPIMVSNIGALGVEVGRGVS